MKTTYLLKGHERVTVTMFSDAEDKKQAETKAVQKLMNRAHGSLGEAIEASQKLAAQLFPGVVHKNNMKRLAEQGATDCRLIPV